MGIPLKLLLIEDSPDDEVLLTRELQRGGYDVTARRVETAGAMRAALLEQGWDAIISDYSMPHFNMPGALALLQELNIDLPFIIVSGTVGEEAAVEALKSGADDFMAKDRLTRLVPALVRAQRNAEGRRERRLRERELEAIAGLASAMRQAETRVELVSIVLNYILTLLRADGAALGLADAQTGETHIELAVAGGAQWSGRRLAPGAGMMGKVIETGEPLVAHGASALEEDLEAPERACVPLVVQRNTMGALWVGRQVPISPEEVRLLLSISDMAATAIQRLSLFEETQRRLERLTALRTIDLAINASQDMRIILGVLLAQVLAQLQIDAADVLLTNPVTQALEYAAGRGFRLRGKPPEPMRFGEGLAGRAAVERRLVRAADLRALGSAFLRRDEMATENFQAYYAMPLLAQGSVNGVLEIFHRGPHQADQEWIEFLETLAGQAAITINNSALFEDLQRSNADLARAYDATIEGWSRALDLRDRETEGHTVRVTNYTLRLAQRMAVSPADLMHTRRGALLHDIGKMGIPDSILHKPGPLTAEEWIVMRRHPTYAFELLSPIAHLRQALDIPHYHHEKWDGSGYPYGLERDRIPQLARIFSIVDVWDALRSDRPYRAGWPNEKVIAYLQAETGKHFDPAVVEAFMEMDLSGGTGPM